MYCFFNINNPKSIFTDINYDADNIFVAPKIDNYKMLSSYGAAIAFGEQRIIYKRIYINYEFQMGLLIPSSFSIDNTSAADTDPKAYVEKAATYRLLKQYAFNVKFGIGYLIF